MKLENAFEVAADPNRAWAFLLDPELVVPCMPGAALKQVIDEDTWEAVAKVKLGPVTMNFKGKVVMEERDDDAYRVVMKAKGSETRGKGMFTATITSTLEATDNGSKIAVVTELKLSGKAATFGRGMVGDVSEKLTKVFANNMAGQLEAIAELEAKATPEPEPEAKPEPEPEPEPEKAELTPKKASKKKRAKKKKKKKKKRTKKKVERRKLEKLAKPPPPKTEAIGGVSLFFWALWRSIKRVFARLFS